MENLKKCYSNTISYLEGELRTSKDDLQLEKEKNFQLLDKIKGKENLYEGPNGSGLYDEKARLK